MIRMRMGDEDAFDRTPRVNLEATLAVVKTAGGEIQNSVHLADYFLIVQSAASFLGNN